MKSAHWETSAMGPRTPPIALIGAFTAAFAQPVAYQPGAVQINVSVAMDRPTTVEADDVQQWCALLGEQSFTQIRTGALRPDQAQSFAAHGFETVQELVVLRLDRPRRTRRDTARRCATRLLPFDRTHLEQVAAADLAAFGFRWAMEPAALSDVLDATPRVRARRAGRAAAGFLISGIDRRTGYLQRLAVHPEHQGRGLGNALVADALRWMARWRATTVFVNTHHDNHAALALYRGHGFVELDTPLLVMERAR